MTRFVVVLISLGLLSACGSSPTAEDQNQATWLKVSAPAVCAATAPAITSKLSPTVSEDLRAELAGSRPDVQIAVTLVQCFTADQAYLDYLADPRIDPAPGKMETFVDPAWRAEFYAAWADSVAKLRAPIYASLRTRVERMGGTVRAVGAESQEMTVELKRSALKILLAERQDILFVSVPAEFPPSP